MKDEKERKKGRETKGRKRLLSIEYNKHSVETA